MKSVKRKWNKGFTLAEMLIVVAIIIVLAGVSFVAVQRHQRSLYQLEFDGIAREIYFAAQNHLTQADTQGLIAPKDTDKSGTHVEKYTNLEGIGGTTNELNDVYYFIGPRTTADTDDILSLMLPANAVDINNSVGSGGTFLILYQKSTATVLDVFYASTDRRFGTNGSPFTDSNFDVLKALRGDNQKSARRRVADINNAIIGYYGGEPALDERITLKAPELKVENAEKLRIFINESYEGDIKQYRTLVLIVRGKTSGAEKTIKLLENGTWVTSDSPTGGYRNEDDTTKKILSTERILDDITTSALHFANIFTSFIPGEDIEIQVKAYSKNAIANITWSAVATTNSLFADPYTYTDGSPALGTHVEKNVAAIANFRHFENLDADISSVGKENSDGKKVTFNKAFQIADMDWDNTATDSKAFVQRIQALNGDNASVSIYAKGNTTAVATNNCLYPVSPSSALAYDGQNHSVSNVKVDFKGNAGLFGTIPAGGSAKNLKLIDFSINTKEGAYDTGALVGSITETDADKIVVSNVLAINSSGTGGKDTNFDNDDNTTKAPNVNAQGNAGGLIGSMTGGTVEKSAAALYVKSTGSNAGGLIGYAESGKVLTSYSGGHTYSGVPSYPTGTAPTTPRNSKSVYPARYYDASNVAMYNVIANANAGGLIGNVGTATISNSYSTCSVSGATAGGFIGNGTGTITITNCYCTGLVKGTTAYGAFAGTTGVTTDPTKPNYYFEIVNEIRNADRDNTGAVTKLNSGYTYMAPLPVVGTGDGKNNNIKAIDESASSYNSFSFPSDSGYAWQTAHPYDNTGLGEYYQHKYNFKTVEQLAGSSVTFAAADFVKEHYGDWPAPEEFIFN